MSLAERINNFNRNLNFSGSLPAGIRVLNPFRDQPGVLELSEAFYQKYYRDSGSRKLILGINPGRLGAGATGIPFTDTKRLAEVCGIDKAQFHTHEPSSVFVYQVIEAFGGPDAFYASYYINSVCPLGFVRQNQKGNWVNYNYYDDPELFEAVKPFILQNLKKQTDFGMDTEVCYVLGKKNARFLEVLNREQPLFGQIRALDHPRYIVQYKSRATASYIEKYLELLAPERT